MIEANPERFRKVVRILGDSRLICDYLNRRARPGTAYLQRAVARMRDTIRRIRPRVIVEHIPRESNAVADWLCSSAFLIEGAVILSEYGLVTTPGGPAPARLVDVMG